MWIYCRRWLSCACVGWDSFVGRRACSCKRWKRGEWEWVRSLCCRRWRHSYRAKYTSFWLWFGFRPIMPCSSTGSCRWACASHPISIVYRSHSNDPIRKACGCKPLNRASRTWRIERTMARNQPTSCLPRPPHWVRNEGPCSLWDSWSHAIDTTPTYSHTPRAPYCSCRELATPISLTNLWLFSGNSPVFYHETHTRCATYRQLCAPPWPPRYHHRSAMPVAGMRTSSWNRIRTGMCCYTTDSKDLLTLSTRFPPNLCTSRAESHAPTFLSRKHRHLYHSSLSYSCSGGK